jgi:hypothetical protein
VNVMVMGAARTAVERAVINAQISKMQRDVVRTTGNPFSGRQPDGLYRTGKEQQALCQGGISPEFNTLTLHTYIFCKQCRHGRR